MSDKQNVLIEVKDLKKHFREGTIHALDGVSMDICRGEVIVIVGPSGSGKSTFLRSLNLLELPTSGEIIFDGVDINAPHVNINKHRQKMGMVFQHFNLFANMTVLKNLTIGPRKLLKMSKEDAETLARSMLERVGLGDRAEAYPSQLSGGQKQRVAIVRAMSMLPDVMLFDEPTSALERWALPARSAPASSLWRTERSSKRARPNRSLTIRRANVCKTFWLKFFKRNKSASCDIGSAFLLLAGSGSRRPAAHIVGERQDAPVRAAALSDIG